MPEVISPSPQRCDLLPSIFCYCIRQISVSSRCHGFVC
jgi:hypothetical protein